MSDKTTDHQPEEREDEERLLNRREFLIGLGKWSRVVIGGAILGAGLLTSEKRAEAGWINRRGYGGGGWINGGGGWINNRGGGSWINNRGGGGWVNFR